MRLPSSTADPTELSPTRLVLTNHMVAASILFNSHLALGTLLSIRRNPIRRLRVIVALLNPLLQPLAAHRIMPGLATTKTKQMFTEALHWLRVEIHGLDDIRAIRGRTPTHQSIAFNEAVRD